MKTGYIIITALFLSFGAPFANATAIADWVSVEPSYSVESVSGLNGGIQRGTRLHGVADLTVEGVVPAGRGFDGIFGGNVMVLHGPSPTDELVGSDVEVSNIDAESTVRLQTLWLGIASERAGITARAGLLALDETFFVVDRADLYLYDGAALPKSLSPNAAIWPVAAPGLEIGYRATDFLDVYAAVVEADPLTLDEDENAHGLRMAWDSGEAVVLAETQWHFAPGGLRGEYRLGGWYDTSTFSDVNTGDPKSGAWGLHVCVDQWLYTKPHDPAQGLGMYGFIGIASPDRVEIALDRAYAAGLDYTGLIPGRTADVVGVGFFTPRIHTSVGASREKAVELTYRAEIAEWFSLQGSVQHILNPGAASGSGLSDATLLMFRAHLAW